MHTVVFAKNQDNCNSGQCQYKVIRNFWNRSPELRMDGIDWATKLILTHRLEPTGSSLKTKNFPIRHVDSADLEVTIVAIPKAVPRRPRPILLQMKYLSSGVVHYNVFVIRERSEPCERTVKKKLTHEFARRQSTRMWNDPEDICIETKFRPVTTAQNSLGEFQTKIKIRLVNNFFVSLRQRVDENWWRRHFT